jgi:hypothetical protein
MDGQVAKYLFIFVSRRLAASTIQLRSFTILLETITSGGTFFLVTIITSGRLDYRNEKQVGH